MLHPKLDSTVQPTKTSARTLKQAAEYFCFFVPFRNATIETWIEAPTRPTIRLAVIIYGLSCTPPRDAPRRNTGIRPIPKEMRIHFATIFFNDFLGYNARLTGCKARQRFAIEVERLVITHVHQ